MACNLDRLTFLQVAQKPAKEMRLQDLALDEFDGFICFSIRCIESFLCRPDWGDSHDSNTLWHAGIHFDLCTIGNCAKEWSTVLDEELIVLYFEDLSLEEAGPNAIREVGLEHALQKLVLAHLNPAERHQIDPLDALGFSDA